MAAWDGSSILVKCTILQYYHILPNTSYSFHITTILKQHNLNCICEFIVKSPKYAHDSKKMCIFLKYFFHFISLGNNS